MTTRKMDGQFWAFSAVGLERLPYKQKVAGSNPASPTYRETRSKVLYGLTFLSRKQNMRGSSVQVRPRLLDVKQFPVDLVVIPNGSRVPLGAFSNMQAAEFDSPTRWVPKRGGI